MAGLFGSITIKGNRLTEFAAQGSSVGIPIPFGYGIFPCDGNVIFAPMPPKEHIKKKKQGKGGVKSEEYSYTLSYAVAFCKGPIYGFLTITRNGKIVWTQDPNATVEDVAYAAKWAQKATFYYGTKTQLPDSTIESYEGSGNVSAFRNLAYIVVEDDDVTDNAGAPPVYTCMAIAHSDGYVTSPPYPLYIKDGIDSESNLVGVAELQWPIEAYDSDTTIVDGELTDLLFYHTIAPEAYDSESDIVSGELLDLLIEYEADPEAYDSSTDIVSGTLT